MKPENTINVIQVKNVIKKFRVYPDKGHTLKEKTLFRKRRSYEERTVLDGISFGVKKGEAVGLIGHNGSGKSTTLKLLTKIMYPDSGMIEMNGRVSSLIELGAGFHPDMSGRENIYINASIFGLTKKEIEARIQDIILFSELEEFIDQPVRTYSSGMYMRLAFAVAIHVDADILLIDEILAVGDANFQSKCFHKLRELKAHGVTIVIVSHSLSQIEQICNRCIWIDAGQVRMEGSPEEVDYAYLEHMGKKAKKKKERVEKEPETVRKTTGNKTTGNKTTGNKTIGNKSDDNFLHADRERTEERKELEIKEAELVHADGSKDDRFRVGEKVILRVKYKKNTTQKISPLMGIKIYRNDGIHAYGTNTQNERIKLETDEEGWIECCFEKMNLVAAVYYVDIAFRTQDMLIYDYKTKIQEFETYHSIYEEGISHLEHSWKIQGLEIHGMESGQEQ